MNVIMRADLIKYSNINYLESKPYVGGLMISF